MERFSGFTYYAQIEVDKKYPSLGTGLSNVNFGGTIYYYIPYFDSDEGCQGDINSILTIYTSLYKPSPARQRFLVEFQQFIIDNELDQLSINVYFSHYSE